MVAWIALVIAALSLLGTTYQTYARWRDEQEKDLPTTVDARLFFGINGLLKIKIAVHNPSTSGVQLTAIGIERMEDDCDPMWFELDGALEPHRAVQQDLTAQWLYNWIKHLGLTDGRLSCRAHAEGYSRYGRHRAWHSDPFTIEPDMFPTTSDVSNR
ncbi:hypothetical protein [Sciscionella sediminilitoris]|uniref:hypothetical protein n=1 Tax=Sciscionella sediminilitoris TaxID=1445613 RepID=UPI0012E135A0|nr:hypothetical protein [Sciscionella sp. SE31]